MQSSWIQIIIVSAISGCNLWQPSAKDIKDVLQTVDPVLCSASHIIEPVQRQRLPFLLPCQQTVVKMYNADLLTSIPPMNSWTQPLSFPCYLYSSIIISAITFKTLKTMIILSIQQKPLSKQKLVDERISLTTALNICLIYQFWFWKWFPVNKYSTSNDFDNFSRHPVLQLLAKSASESTAKLPINWRTVLY